MRVEYLSVREAINKTGQSEKKIRSMIRDGRLNFVRIGYHILIPRTEIRKLRA